MVLIATWNAHSQLKAEVAEELLEAAVVELEVPAGGREKSSRSEVHLVNHHREWHPHRESRNELLNTGVQRLSLKRLT